MLAPKIEHVPEYQKLSSIIGRRPASECRVFLQLQCPWVYIAGLRIFPPIGMSVSCAEKRGRVPNEKVLSKEIIETTQKTILRAEETIRRSRELLTVMREVQADRERRELYKILRLPIS